MYVHGKCLSLSAYRQAAFLTSSACDHEQYSRQRVGCTPGGGPWQQRVWVRHYDRDQLCAQAVAVHEYLRDRHGTEMNQTLWGYVLTTFLCRAACTVIRPILLDDATRQGAQSLMQQR